MRAWPPFALVMSGCLLLSENLLVFCKHVYVSCNYKQRDF